MLTMISARKQAQASGAKQYESGRPCKRGHLAPRFTGNGECTTCTAIRGAKWVAQPENKRMVAARVVIYRGIHAEKYSAMYASWRAENIDKAKQKDARYLRENPERARAKCARRRALKMGAEGSHTIDEVKALLARQKFKCAICKTGIKVGYQEDHIISLVAGGSDWIRNIQLLCKPCNCSKGAKHPITFAQQRGMLL